MIKSGHSSSLMNVGRPSQSEGAKHCIQAKGVKSYNVRASASMYNLESYQDKTTPALRHGVVPQQFIEKWKNEIRQIEDLSQCLYRTSLLPGNCCTGEVSAESEASTSVKASDTEGENSMVIDADFLGEHGYFLRSRGCVNCAAFKKHTHCFDTFDNTNCNSSVSPITCASPLKVTLPVKCFLPAKSNEGRRNYKGKQRREKSKVKKKDRVTSEKKKKNHKKSEGKHKKKVKGFEKEQTVYGPYIVPLRRRYPVADPLLVNLLKSKTACVARALNLECCNRFCCTQWCFPFGCQVYVDYL